MSLRDEANAAGEVAELRGALDRALRAHAAEKARTDRLVDAVYRAAHDAALTVTFPDVPPPARDPRPGAPEVAIIVLSDWQLGKVTPTYNSDVAEERIDALWPLIEEKVLERRQVCPVREARIWALGDMVEGNAIFPGQAWQVDSSTYTQVFRGSRMLGSIVRRAAATFEALRTVGIIGNHGRDGKRGDVDPETNWDRVLYRHTAEVLEGRPGMDHVEWVVPEGKGETNWYHVDRVGRYGSLLFHGYNLKGHAGFPWYGLGKKVGGWALGAIEEFRIAEESQLDVDFGHWHQPTKITLNRVMARCAGSTESHNTFAQENLAAVGRPSQQLRFVRPDTGRVTAEHDLWLA